MGDQGDQVCEPRLTLQPRGQYFYIRAGARLKICRVRTARAREAAVPEDPLFGTRLFVCTVRYIWVVQYGLSTGQKTLFSRRNIV